MIQAALGNPDKQYLLALQSEPDEAFDLYRDAAAKGHLQAQISLAFIYQYGSLKPDQKNLFKALEIYEALAKRDYVPSEALIGLCRIYLYGSEEDGIAVDHLRSFEYCSQAAERKDPEGLYYLYVYHTYKSNVPKEKLPGGFNRGIEYFHEAMKRESRFSQGEMNGLKTKCLTPDNIVHSADQAWNCERLASLGDPAAQFIMGGLYDTGTFRKKNTKAMMYWFQRSSAQKYAKASAVLGIFYAQGKEGVEQNDRQALAYFQRAVNDSGGILPEEIEERAEYITMRNLHYAVMDEKRNTE
ncbi:MAG: tetratricopeptide repeat protein, partial [Bdellovibrionales bacterium]|nr:tetratricopeptide repeat protein [Bdellovibrionales bacterium]